MPEAIAAVILAAGESRRFGSNKLLHPVKAGAITMPLAAKSLMPWFQVFSRVTVVVKPGADAFCEAVEASLRKKPDWVVCPDSKEGMAFSLACGVRKNFDAKGWVIGLADMPVLPECAIFRVKEALLSGAPLAAPCMNGRRGHPAGFSFRYLEALLSLEGDGGAREILLAEESLVERIEMEDHGIFADIDFPEDLGIL